MPSRRKMLSSLAMIPLLGVSGCTQNQATQTGAETTATADDKGTLTETDEVTAEIQKGVQIRGLAGTVDDQGEKIQNLKIDVGLVSGSEPVDLSELTYTIELPENSAVINGDPSQTSGLSFRSVEDVEDDSTVLRDSEDLGVIEFELSNIDQIEPIKSDVSFTITVDVPDSTFTKAAFLTPSRGKLKESEEYVFYN